MKLKSRIISYINHRRFKFFENKIYPLTWEKHDQILEWAVKQKSCDFKINTKNAEDPIFQQGVLLREAALRNFKNKYSDLSDIRILVHVPSASESPGGFSVFNNLIQNLNFLGIKSESLNWNDDLAKKLNEFQPTVFLTSDNPSFLNRINWEQIANYTESNNLFLGLTAQIDSEQIINNKLKWAEKNQVSFFYVFHSDEYIEDSNVYTPYIDQGYKMFSLEFGANILKYYPVPSVEKDLDYIFLASSNPDKWNRYFKYLPKIFKKHAGFIDGPGWNKIQSYLQENICQEAQNYVYARAKVGLNLHLQSSIDFSDELNERTYILAACGIPQLIDNPKLLNKRFSSDAVFTAESPGEYYDLFLYILNHPEEASKKALCAMNEVYEKHTTLHRAEKLILFLNKTFRGTAKSKADVRFAHCKELRAKR